MDFLDKTIEKVKEVSEVVGKKTGEVVSVQKLKFNIASLETKIEKDYVVLGKLFYNLIEDGGEVSDDAKEIAETIKVKYAEIEKLKKEINDIKQD